MSLLKALLEILDDAKRTSVEQGGVAGREMQEPPGSASPWSLPPTGPGPQRPPGSKSPFSWP